jgi:hypothetical protein
MAQGPNAPYTNLDQNQILQRVFEEGQDKLRVDAQVTATIGTIECIINASSGDNIAITNQDGSNPLVINTDGSINVKVLQTTPPPLKIRYNEITNVVSGVTTTLISYTPSVDIKVVGVDVNGTNIATYEVMINGTIVDKKYTSLTGELYAEFVLTGLVITSGQNFSISVVHFRPNTGDFNASIKYVEN